MLFIRPKICCFFENFSVDNFKLTALHSSDKVLYEQQIFELMFVCLGGGTCFEHNFHQFNFVETKNLWMVFLYLLHFFEDSFHFILLKNLFFLQPFFLYLSVGVFTLKEKKSSLMKIFFSSSHVLQE